MTTAAPQPAGKGADHGVGPVAGHRGNRALADHRLSPDRALAASAVTALDGGEHTAGLACEFRRLTDPDDLDRRAAALLRHPDLVQPITDLHRSELHRRLEPVTGRTT
ncbi:hypothetical protein AB0J80_27950 [Actinoplanes sp. NPDC049548]|uniref:hypothetical protein n=1 Tax=Actinoplanes sp. NPDC049548 TaxID=3155152 RepID=UPI003448FED9